MERVVRTFDLANVTTVPERERKTNGRMVGYALRMRVRMIPLGYFFISM